MRRTFLPKAQKSFVDGRRRKKFLPIFCAGGDEVDGLATRTGTRGEAGAAFEFRRS